MKRSEQLQQVIAKSIDGVLAGSLSTDNALAAARLANVEVKTVFAELTYQRHRSDTSKIKFFEDTP